MPSGSRERVLVTGTSGLLGRRALNAFQVAGFEVISIDRTAPEDLPSGVVHHCADLASWEGMDAALRDADVVVHIAALTDVAATSATAMLSGNVALSSRVLIGAAEAGVARIVYASSQSALGFSRAPRPLVPDYVPVDEAHRTYPTESYGVSKRIGEEICAMIAGSHGIPTVSLRFPVIWAPGMFAGHVALRMGDPVQAVKSFWSYVDVRDAAEAVRLAAFVDLPAGHTVLDVSAGWPFCDGDIRDHVAAHYGAVPGASALDADSPIYAVDRAAAVLGFRARYRWWPDRIEDTAAKSASSPG